MLCWVEKSKNSMSMEICWFSTVYFVMLISCVSLCARLSLVTKEIIVYITNRRVNLTFVFLYNTKYIYIYFFAKMSGLAAKKDRVMHKSQWSKWERGSCTHGRRDDPHITTIYTLRNVPSSKNRTLTICEKFY